MDTLPTKIQLRIFSSLTRAHLVKVRFVCKKWQRLINGLMFGKKISIDGRTRGQNEIVLLMRNNAVVREIEFLYVKNWNFVHYLPAYANIRTISFKLCLIDRSSFKELIRRSPLTETLRAQLVNVKYDDCFIELLIRWENLKNISLTLSRALSAGYTDFRIRLFIKTECPKLQSLELIGFDVSKQYRIHRFTQLSALHREWIVEFDTMLKKEENSNKSLLAELCRKVTQKSILRKLKHRQINTSDGRYH